MLHVSRAAPLRFLDLELKKNGNALQLTLPRSLYGVGTFPYSKPKIPPK